MQAYIIGSLGVVTQALYLVLLQKCSQSLSAVETLHLNSYNTLPFLLVVCSVSGQLSQAMFNFPYQNMMFVFVFILVIVMGCGLNYMLFLCTTYNCALTTSITGTLKSIVQTAIGMFTFGGISINTYTITGICLNLTGGMGYSFTKWKESQVKISTSSSGLCDIERGQVKSHEYTNGFVPSLPMTHTVSNRDSTNYSTEQTS